MKFSDPSKQTMAGLRVIFDLLRPSISRSAFFPVPSTVFDWRIQEFMVEVIGTLDGYSTIHPDQFDLGLRTLDRDPAGHEEMVGRRLGKLQLAVYGTKSYFADRPVPG